MKNDGREDLQFLNKSNSFTAKTFDFVKSGVSSEGTDDEYSWTILKAGKVSMMLGSVDMKKLEKIGLVTPKGDGWDIEDQITFGWNKAKRAITS